MTTTSAAVAYQDLTPVQMWTSNNNNINQGTNDEVHSRINFHQDTDLLIGYHQDAHQMNLSMDNNQLWSFGGADPVDEHSIALPPLQMSAPTTSGAHWSMPNGTSTTSGQIMASPQLQHHSMALPSYNLHHHHHHGSKSNESRPHSQGFTTGQAHTRRKIVLSGSGTSMPANNMGQKMTSATTTSMSSQPEELCLVCGDKASGYHYNALTCEGCKGFFRRSITRKANYYCKYGGQCEIDMYMRRKCQDCRLRKCVAVGMRAELVIPEEQCRLKRESKIKMRTSNGGSFNGSGSPLASGESFNTKEERKSNSPQQVTSTENLSPNPVAATLTPEHQELIHRILLCQEQYDYPSNEDLAKIQNRNQLLPLLADLTVLNIQLIVDFAKCLPGFSTLCKNDQLILLKACCNELLVLKLAKHYDSKNDRIFCGQQPQPAATLQSTYGWSFSREMFKEAGLGSCADGIFDFAKSMTTIKADSAEYGLLSAISLYSDRSGLMEAKKVEDIQEVYTSALQSYIDVQRPKARNTFARLLMKLTDIRTLGAQFADLILTRTTTQQQNVSSINSDMSYFQHHQQDFHHKNGGDLHRNVSENNFKNLGVGEGISNNSTKQYNHFRRASYAGTSPGHGTPTNTNFKSDFSSTTTSYLTSSNFRLIKSEPVNNNNNMATPTLPPNIQSFIVDDDPSTSVVDYFETAANTEAESSSNLHNFHAYINAASPNNDSQNDNTNNQKQPVMPCTNFPDFVKVDFFDTRDSN